MQRAPLARARPGARARTAESLLWGNASFCLFFRGGDLHLLVGLMRNHLEVRLGVAFKLFLPEYRCWLTY